MGLTVSEEYLTLAEDIVSLDHHPPHRNKIFLDLPICYVYIHDIEIARDTESGLEMYVELLKHIDSDSFPIHLCFKKVTFEHFSLPKFKRQNDKSTIPGYRCIKEFLPFFLEKFRILTLRSFSKNPTKKNIS